MRIFDHHNRLTVNGVSDIMKSATAIAAERLLSLYLTNENKLTRDYEERRILLGLRNLEKRLTQFRSGGDQPTPE